MDGLQSAGAAGSALRTQVQFGVSAIKQANESDSAVLKLVEDAAKQGEDAARTVPAGRSDGTGRLVDIKA